MESSETAPQAAHPAGALGARGLLLSVGVYLAGLGAGIRVGHAGGTLVYEHGAASAYSDAR